MQEKVHFQYTDAREPLPFSDQAFDALVCIDVICHLPNSAR
jgi:ubiquinone/menaquinone biosynthesis C-methylase UbiE